MNNFARKKEISKNGFTIIANVYTNEEVESLLQLLSKVDFSNAYFRKTEDLFAIRQFLKVVPEAIPIIFNNTLKGIISNLFGDEYFAVKSIYFDKPETSNWFVAYHQDLTISVNERIDLPGFNNWTKKEGHFSVQPPLSILENNFTIRIHLDDTDEKNGALKVLTGTHKKGVLRVDANTLKAGKEVSCNVPKGGVMIMRPLLLHSSSRTTNQQRRRVMHLEFSNKELPGEFCWAESIISKKGNNSN